MADTSVCGNTWPSATGHKTRRTTLPPDDLDIGHPDRTTARTCSRRSSRRCPDADADLAWKTTVAEASRLIMADELDQPPIAAHAASELELAAEAEKLILLEAIAAELAARESAEDQASHPGRSKPHRRTTAHTTRERASHRDRAKPKTGRRDGNSHTDHRLTNHRRRNRR